MQPRHQGQIKASRLSRYLSLNILCHGAGAMGQDEGRGPEQEVDRHLKRRRQPDQLHRVYATVPGLDLHDHRPV
jgi:hypothetical protein